MPRTAWSPGQRLLTAGMVFMVTAVGFEGLAVPTVLPATLAELGELPLYGWAFSGFWLANLVGITLAGAEADRRGSALPFSLGTGCFALGLLVAGLAPAMAWVVVGRVIQGLGAGAIASITYVAIARGYDAPARPRMIAIVSSAWVVPGLLGPALAGYLAQELSWRWAFLGLAPLLPVAAVVVLGPFRGLGPAGPTARTAGQRRNLRDAVQLAVGAGALLGALSGGGLPLVVGMALAGALLVGGPLRRLLPSGTLTARPGPGAAIALLALLNVAFFGVEAFVPLTVSSVRGAGPVAGGLALTASALTWAAGSWLQARLAASRSRRSVAAAGLALVALGIGLEAVVPLTAGVPVWLAAAAWAVAGLGMGLAYSAITLATIETATAGAEGAASTAVQLANTLGVALGTGLAGGVVALAAASTVGLAPGIAIANVLMLIVCGVGLAVAAAIPERAALPGGAAGDPTAHGPAL